MRHLRDPLVLTGFLLVAILVLLPHSGTLFAGLFPALQTPVYTADSFLLLALDHTALVLAAAAISAMIGIGAAILVTRPWGSPFRALAETLVAIGQTIPPVAVLALAVPSLGFGPLPALIALTLYGLLPILQSALAGLDGVPAPVREAADGMGFSGARRLAAIEFPLALPLIIAGLRTAVVAGVGTATIASTIGVRSLGTPIILGLNGNNTAFILQGAIPVALLAIFLDLALGRAATMASHISR